MITLTETEEKAPDLEYEQSYSGFLKSRRSAITRSVYETGIHVILGESTKPDVFLEFARMNPKRAEAKIIQWMYEFRDLPGRYGRKPSGATIRAYLSSLRSFLDFCDVKLNWKRIIQVTPKPRRASKKRAYNLEEIRKLYDSLDYRGKFAVLFYSSTGARLAAVEDPRPLTIGDIERLNIPTGEEGKKVTIGHIKIYSEDSEEYDAFLTDEALEALDAYLNYRQNFGEEITSSSPLFRCELDVREARKDPSKREKKLRIRPASANAIKGQIQKGLTAAGLGEREFKMVHGFRSFYKSMLESSEMKSIFIERLLGHFENESDPDRYLKLDAMGLAEQFVKYMHRLYVSQGRKAQIRIQELEEAKDKVANDYYLRWKQAEDRLKDLEVNQRRVLALLEQALREREKES